MFGHAGDGHVHVNALPDTSRPGWRDAIAGLFTDAADLLVRLGGTPSGEHGDGRLRAGLGERFYGVEGVALFSGLKSSHGPVGRFIPGGIPHDTESEPAPGL